MPTAEKIAILDTTLRDGQQSPGAGMSIEDNLEYAKLAVKLNVDVLEAGFPAASKSDYASVNEIAQMIASTKSPTIVACLCQTREDQVTTTMKALEPLNSIGKARLHCYLPVSPSLMKASLGKAAENKTKLITSAVDMISLAVKNGYEVEFTCEGYSRSFDNFQFVTDLLLAVAEAGTSVIGVADTIGGAAKYQGPKYFVNMLKRHARIIGKSYPNMLWSVHCHNDFGLALENTMNAIVDGPARELQGCINGIGERAGNVSLEQCIMVIEEFLEGQFYHTINLSELQRISDFVSNKMLQKSCYCPIVGTNIAKHSAGGHTNAILKDPFAYQPFDPKKIGSQITLVFGPMSGGNHAKQIIESQGYYLDDSEKAHIAQELKIMFADRRKGITDEELLKGYILLRSPIKIDNISYRKTTKGMSAIVLDGQFFGQNRLEFICSGENSAIAAFGKAVDQKFPGIKISQYQSSIDNDTTTDAKCHTRIQICVDDQYYFESESSDQDLIVSVIKAYAMAVNSAFVYFNYHQEMIHNEQNHHRQNLG